MNAPSSNTVVIVMAVLGAVYKLWKAHKAHQSMLSALLANARQIVLTLAASPVADEKARQLIEAGADALLGRMGIKRDGDIDQVVHAIIEQGMLELKQRQMPGQLDQVAAGAAAVNQAFTPPAKPDVPPLDIQLEQEP